MVQFSGSGKPTGKVTIPKVVRSDAKRKQELSPVSFDVSRRAGTKRPYSAVIPGTIMTTAFMVAYAAPMHTSVPRRSSSQVRDGAASGEPSRTVGRHYRVSFSK